MPEARVPPGLQVLFAKVTMFTVTFPLTPAIALFVVWSETKSDIRRMLKYERRKVPRRLAYEHAIGPWYSILVVQTILGIVFSSFFFAFSTGELEATYVHVITTLSALPHFVATNSRKALAALELASSSLWHDQVVTAVEQRLFASRPSRRWSSCMCVACTGTRRRRRRRSGAC